MESPCQKYITTVDNLRETIQKFGVAIIPNVINENECKNMLDDVWNYFEHITQNWEIPFKRDDQSTWREFYKLLPLHSMLIQHWGVGHCQASWNLRQNPKIVQIFASLWNVQQDELLVSFDGLSFQLPPEIIGKGHYKTPWLHTDQSYQRNDFECVQSWISALDVENGDATLMVLEGSNKYHKDFAEHFNIKDKDDWYKPTTEQLKFYTDIKKCEPVHIVCGKGDLVLWDSKLIHCGIEARKGRANENFRCVSYICMLPRLGTSNANLKKKQKAFRELRTTKHHPQKSLLFNKNPRTYDGQLPEITPINEPNLTDLGMKLAGF